MSSPIRRSAPPQVGQVQGAAWSEYVLTRQLFRQRASRRLLCFDRALDYGCYAWRGSREQLGLIGLQCLDRQLRRRQNPQSLLGTRPDESTPLQTLGEQAQPVAIPPQQLHEIAAATAKAEHMSRERVLTEHGLRLHRQAVEAFAHVGDARCQ